MERSSARGLWWSGRAHYQRYRHSPNSLVLGSPAKVVKDLGPESADNNHKWAEKYVKVAARYTERVINPGF